MMPQTIDPDYVERIPGGPCSLNRRSARFHPGGASFRTGVNVNDA